MSYGLFGDRRRFGRLHQLKRWGQALARWRGLARTVDSKPIWAQLNITERCNLDCAYCVEHNNRGRHVPLSEVRCWLEHCRDLGVRHVELIGGEPLLHPQLHEMLAHAQQLGMNTGFTTNGFLLKGYDANKLVGLGVKRLQLSIDTMEPNTTTRKALSLLKPALEQLCSLPVWFRVNSLLVEGSLNETKQLANELFKLNVPVSFAPVHTHGLLKLDDPKRYIEILDWLKEQKRQNQPVDMPWFLLDYYRKLLAGTPISWTCEGGCKAFYVDPNGDFRYCSQGPAQQPFLEVTSETLARNHRRRKGCENACGVQCMLITSLPFSRLGYVLATEYQRASVRRSSGAHVVVTTRIGY